MMGSSSSKTNKASLVEPSTDIHVPTDCIQDYQEVCKQCSEVRSFDQTLLANTTRTIGFFARDIRQDEEKASSMAFFKVGIDSIMDMDRNLVNFLLKSKKDICNDEDLLALVDEYFESSIKTYDFCTALDKWLNGVREKQLMIKLAVHPFDKEFEQQMLPDAKYTETLKGLKRFLDTEDPFTAEFSELFHRVYVQQISMLQKLQDYRKTLEKKIKSLKSWKKVCTVLFVTAFVSVLVLSVVAAAIAAPPVVTALAGALAVPIGSAGKWCSSLWEKYIKEVTTKRELVSMLERGTRLSDMTDICMIVRRLQITIESIVQNAETALGEENAVPFLVDEIKKKLETFEGTVEDISKHVEKCRKYVKFAREQIVQKIMRLPDN